MLFCADVCQFHWHNQTWPLCLNLLTFFCHPIKRYFNPTSNVPLWRQSHQQPVTSHRNNKNTTPTNKSAPEALNTSQTLQYKHNECVSRWSFPFNTYYLYHIFCKGTYRVVFTQHQFFSESSSLGVETVTCPCSTHHLYQHSSEIQTRP